jgi:hypothetical protein
MIDEAEGSETMLNKLNELPPTENTRLQKAHQEMTGLIAALNKREVPQDIAEEINIIIANLNAFTGDEKQFARELNQAYQHILKLVQEKLNWVPKDFYRNQWMAMGLSVFGLPMGVALGIALDNMAFMAAFLPLGMIMGMGVGSGMDKKAAEEGRVLEI